MFVHMHFLSLDCGNHWTTCTSISKMILLMQIMFTSSIESNEASWEKDWWWHAEETQGVYRFLKLNAKSMISENKSVCVSRCFIKHHITPIIYQMITEFFLFDNMFFFQSSWQSSKASHHTSTTDTDLQHPNHKWTAALSNGKLCS